MPQLAYKLQSADDPFGGAPKGAGFDGYPLEGEDLAYRVEVWDAEARYVETVVAVTANSAIGFAAFYAAAREYADRDITLRHKDRILSRWTGRAH